ncbi:UDP-glucose/GDP-mannose dehydrogenase [Mycena galericulata]|nr:UDP-glucose/GDP-mannose dehydrogenase [Mycena galericulata]
MPNYPCMGGPTCAVITLNCAHITVTTVDLQARIDAWNTSDFKLHIYEPSLEDVVRQCRGCNLFFSTDVEKGIREAELIFVSVNTPTKKSGVAMYVELATRKISAIATSSKIVVEKSTVPCHTAESMRTILEADSKPNCRFDNLSNPEHVRLAGVYANWVRTEQILTVGLWSSKLSKLAMNAMLTQRISSVNALSAVCEATGANIDKVANAVGYDSRVGPQFLKASIGFGSSCFQKDILNHVYLSESLHLPEMNEYQKRLFSKHVVYMLFNTITGKRIAVLGFAFKADTGDTCESAAITLIRNFQSKRLYQHRRGADLPPSPLTRVSFQLIVYPLERQVTSAPPRSRCAATPEAIHMKKPALVPAFVFDVRLLVAAVLTQIGFKSCVVRVTTIGRPSL